MKKVYTLIGILQIILISGCATHAVQYSEISNNSEFNSSGKQLEKTIYLIGDAGGAELGESTDALKAFKDFVAEKNTKEIIQFSWATIFMKRACRLRTAKTGLRQLIE